MSTQPETSLAEEQRKESKEAGAVILTGDRQLSLALQEASISVAFRIHQSSSWIQGEEVQQIALPCLIRYLHELLRLQVENYQSA